MATLEEESEKWWKERIKQHRKKAQQGEDYTKMKRRKIGPGSMISFSYINPKTPLKILRFFDQFPVVIIFSDRGNLIYGINLHYAPRPFRKTILSYVIKLNKANIRADRRFTLSWESIKEFVIRNGLNLLVHKYIKSRMTSVDYVKGSEWKYVSELPSHKFITSKDMTEEELYRMIYSHSKKTKKSKNVRTGR